MLHGACSRSLINDHPKGGPLCSLDLGSDHLSARARFSAAARGPARPRIALSERSANCLRSRPRVDDLASLAVKERGLFVRERTSRGHGVQGKTS